jgi:tRNA A-37 threonylcarbamoyl transferase component Bud32/ligand-binding sensor domain-containing protein
LSLVCKPIVLVLLASAGFGQQYPFLSVPGSPKSVKSLFQDSRGRLWLGGQQSACFDGTRFFFLRDYGFPDAEAYDFSEDPGGSIWIGAATGIYRFANGTVEQIGTGVAVSVIAVSANLAIAATGPPGLGIPTNTTLLRMQRSGDRWTAETVMTLDSPGPLTLDRLGTLLYPGSGKAWSEIRVEDVVRWRRGAALPVIRHPADRFPDNGPVKVMRDRQGCLWVAADGGTGYDCGKGNHVALFDGANTRSRIHEGSDGAMVLWGDSLLAVGRPGSFRIATRANGLPGMVDAIPGRDGTIWIGTTQGLYRLASPFQVEYWTIRDGVAYAPWSLARSDGRLYAGLDSGRIVILDANGSRWNAVGTFEGRGMVSALLPIGGGTLLAGFSGNGVLLLGANGKVLASTGKDHRTVAMRLARTPDGEIWLGGGFLERVSRDGPLLKLENHPLQTQPSRNILAIKYQEETRKLWACYNGGLVVRDAHGSWTEISNRDGLVGNGCWSMAPLPNGDVWYASFLAHTLSLIRPGADGRVTIRQYDANDGIPDPGGDTMDADQRGWLWRGGEQGVFVADAAEAEAGKWMQLDQTDGFPANGMNSGSVFVDNDRSLWWGADNDLVHYSPPSDLVTPRFSPQVFISGYSWSGQEPRLAEAVRALPHGVKVSAHIGTLQFDRRNALRLRYRILPDQQAWRESQSLDLALGSLSSGGHTLEVQGRVFTGPWSPVLSQSITILGPAWSSWPLLLLYGIAFTTLASFGYVAHRRQRAERAELLPNLAAWRVGALLPEVHELAGTLLDSRFEVGDLLARGGFANVMDGYDRAQKKRCAVKVFRSEVKDMQWIQRRFEQEVTALQRVRHPNVVSIYAHGSAPYGAPYLIMEFIEGRSLREVLEHGALSLNSTARMLEQLGGALDAIHAHGIWHRDVKPENIIVRGEGAAVEAVLIDFSIAIVKDANETLYGLSRAAGTFDYMAPEQAIGYAEASSDIYSLSKIVIEMLTGRRLSYLLPDACLDLPDRVRDLLKNLDIRLSGDAIDILARALEFDPTKRPRVAGSLAKIVADCLGDIVTAAQIRKSPPSRTGL